MGSVTHSSESPQRSSYSILEYSLQQAASDAEVLKRVFSEVWQTIRSGNFYAGQPRNAASGLSVLLARQALEAATRAGGDGLIGEAHRMMAYALNADERYEESVDHYEQAIKALENAGELHVAARTRLGLIAALFMSGQYEKAIDAGETAERWFSKSGDEEGSARLKANIGNLYHRLDQHAGAAAFQQAAIDVFTKLENPPALAQCYLNLGAALSMLDRFDEADLAFHRSEELSRELGLDDLYAQARYNRVYLFFQQGQYGKAISGFEQLRTYFTASGSERFIALCDLDEAELYLQLNVPAKARALAHSAEQAFDKIGLNYERAKAMTFAGIALMQDREFQEAMTVFVKARSIFGVEQNARWIASVDLFRAQALLAVGRAGAAHRLASAARSQFEILNVRSWTAASLAVVARAELQMGLIEEARSHAAEIASLTDETQMPLHLFTCHSVCGQVEEAIGNATKAIKHYSAAANSIEAHRAQINRDELRVAFSADKQHVYEALVHLCLNENSDAATAYQWCERAKSRALVDMLSNRAGIATAEVVFRSLSPGQALIEYFVAEGEVLAFVLYKGSLQVYRSLCTLGELESMREWLQFHIEPFAPQPAGGLDEPALQSTNHHLQELYQRLIGPVVKRLEADHLVIVPHGVMHDLPFHAFYDGEQYLIDRFAISYAPSAAVFHYCIETPEAHGRPLIVGVADDAAPLIEDEIRALDRIFPDAHTLFGSEATTTAFENLAVCADFVHIATHAVFRREDPMRSAFRLANGWISALDLYSIKCDANLVTLSGCRSGVSQVSGTDELLGLKRGLLYAGARSLLVSLWNLNDEAACEFMMVFYEKWLAGTSRVEALRAASLVVRGRHPHPFYWAPFYLVGKA